jgi:hypothetical protein
MLLIETPENQGLLTVKVSGKLTAENYETFVPKVEEMIERNGKLRIMLLMENFHGWNAGALWEDTKFAMKHFNDIERLAMVGDKKWEKGMATFCKPFTRAKIQYFDISEIEEAKKWATS